GMLRQQAAQGVQIGRKSKLLGDIPGADLVLYLAPNALRATRAGRAEHGELMIAEGADHHDHAKGHGEHDRETYAGRHELWSERKGAAEEGADRRESPQNQTGTANRQPEREQPVVQVAR